VDEFAAVIKAREFVRKANPDSIPVRVEAYIDEAKAVLRKQNDLGPEEPGWSFCSGGKHYICVNASDRPERQRFTICHELAHILLGIKSEHNALPWWSYAKRPPGEIICDVFAAELLLPYRSFKSIADDTAIEMRSIEELADRFLASITATGSRFVAVHTAPCAFVLSEQGKVRYASRSNALRDACGWIQPRLDLPRGSLSERIRGGAAPDGPEKVDADIWLADWERGGVLFEEAKHFSQCDQTLTLLSFVNDEVPPAKKEELREDEEELGLQELDGNLRWPSKKRRR
jgi:Zn-dependent peptidase ImmA (M78 family)